MAHGDVRGWQQKSGGNGRMRNRHKRPEKISYIKYENIGVAHGNERVGRKKLQNYGGAW